MTRSEAQLRAALQQILAERLTNKPGSIDARCERLEDLVRDADAAGYRVLAFTARQRLAGAYRVAGRWDLIFTVFSRCLADYDAAPEVYGAGAGSSLCDGYLEVVSGMAEFPEISLDRIGTALGEIERRYGTSGRMAREIDDARRYVAQIRGVWDDEERHRRAWLAHGGRTAHGDLWGLVGEIERLLPRGDARSVAQAMALARPALDGQVTFDEPPAPIQCDMLLPLARAGAWDDAVTAFGRARLALREGLYRYEYSAMLFEFCALTGNELLGVTLAQQNLGDYPTLRRPYGQMQYATALAVLCRRMIEIGLGDRVIQGYAGGDALSARVWHERMREVALDLADRFDARNRTSTQGDQVRARLAATPLIDFLQLDPACGPWRPPRPIPPDQPPEQLLQTAEWYAWREDGVEAGRYLAAVGDPPPEHVAHWAAALRASVDGSLRPVERFAKAAEHCRLAGDRPRALRYEAERLVREAWQKEGEKALAAITKLCRAARSLDLPALSSFLETARAEALVATNRRDDGFRALERAVSLARSAGEPLDLGAALLYEAQLRGKGPADRQLAVARAAKDALIAAGAPVLVHRACSALWEAALRGGTQEWFLLEIDRDVELVGPAATERLRGVLLQWRGTCLLHAGRGAYAFPDLAEAAMERMNRDRYDWPMLALYGVALHAVGRFEDAVGELGLPGSKGTNCDVLAEPSTRRTLAYPELADHARRALAESYLAIGQPGRAVAEWDRLVEQAADPTLALQARAEAARVVQALGDLDEAGERYAAAAGEADRQGRTEEAARLRRSAAACRQEASASGPRCSSAR